MHRIASLLLAPMTLILPLTVGAAGQEQSPPETALPVPRGAAPDAPGDPALLREGSQLIDVTGAMARDDVGNWVFHVPPTTDQAPALTLILLPCVTLADMEAALDAVGEHPVRFELTGEVFAFHSRNFLLPTTAPRLVDATRLDSPPAQTDSDADGGEAAEDDEGQAGDRAEQIMQALVRDTGPIARTGGSTLPVRVEETDSKLLREDTLLVNRRGRLTRDGGGVWRVVFDADAEGLSDPPMRLLPCLLLERMSAYALRAGRNAPVLISGKVTVYRGHNFLLPTLYRVPNERTLINTP